MARRHRARGAFGSRRSVLLPEPRAASPPPVRVNRPSPRATVPRFSGGSKVFQVPFARAAMASALIVAPAAHAASDADLTQLREEIRQLKQSYEARIEALEARVKAAETATSRSPQGTLPASAPPVATTPSPAASATAAAGLP